MNDTPHLPHPRLLELRDAAPAADEARHLEHCPACAEALRAATALRAALRALPAPAPARDGWRAARAALHASRAARTRPAWLALAAAGLVAAAGWLAFHPPPAPAGAAPAPATSAAAAPPRAPELRDWIERSRALETRLAAQEESPDAISGAQARRYFMYEDGVREIDARLADPTLKPAAAATLWRDRVTLLSGMMRARNEGAARPRAASI